MVNLTGENINLEAEAYSIREQSNGFGDWIGEVLLEGELELEETFLIGNESAPISAIISESNQLKTGAPLDFNGNDPVGLFKDGELIDVIGYFNNDEDFANEQTLRRNQTVIEPSLEYNADDLQFLDTDTVSRLNEY